MTPKSTLLRTTDTQLCGSLNQPQPIFPELLGACYEAHYRYVLQVCRQHFRQPEDAEDAASHCQELSGTIERNYIIPDARRIDIRRI
jgi:hypothetical protein